MTHKIRSGYVHCKCPDCFDMALASDTHRGAFCPACKSAGCNGRGDCARPDAYGGLDMFSESDLSFEDEQSDAGGL